MCQQTESIEKSAPRHNIQITMDAFSNNSGFNELRVLVVDDDKQMLSFVSFVLRDMGISTVLKAEGGEDALSFFTGAQAAADIIICDLMMPDINGLDVLKSVREKHPGLPFLMLTANGTIDALAVARKAGVDAYVIKPFKPDEIINKVRLLAKKLLLARPSGGAASGSQV